MSPDKTWQSMAVGLPFSRYVYALQTLLRTGGIKLRRFSWTMRLSRRLGSPYHADPWHCPGIGQTFETGILIWLSCGSRRGGYCASSP